MTEKGISFVYHNIDEDAGARSASVITGTSDENGQLSVPVTVDPLVPTEISAAAGAAATNILHVYPSGDTSTRTLVAVIPLWNGKYAVVCDCFNYVAGAEVDISYDTSAVSGPVIERGPFALNAPLVSSTATAGNLRIACLWPSISGNGHLAFFYFDQETATSSGIFSSMQVQLVDVQGGSIPVRTLLIN